jgi:hypothetical protein
MASDEIPAGAPASTAPPAGVDEGHPAAVVSLSEHREKRAREELRSGRFYILDTDGSHIPVVDVVGDRPLSAVETLAALASAPPPTELPTATIAVDGLSITCTTCGTTSDNAADVAERQCPHCGLRHQAWIQLH